MDLPDALDRAIDHLPGERFDAIVVDEGQDFDDRWLASLDALLVEPGEGVLWVFHDPAQALYRDDRVASLGLDEFPMHENFRNPGPIHRLAARFYHGPDEVVAWREDGLEPEIIEAAPGRPTVEAVRRVLHRLTVEEGEWLDELLCVGITRAKGHLVVVGPPGPLRPNRVDVSD